MIGHFVKVAVHARWFIPVAASGGGLTAIAVAALVIRRYRAKRLEKERLFDLTGEFDVASNRELLAHAQRVGRSVILDDDIDAFVDPRVPLTHLFELGDELGHGDFGSVHRGTYRGISYAIKEFIEQGDAEREFLIGLKLDHEAFVKIYHSVHKMGRDYIIMELIDGTPLKDIAPDPYYVRPMFEGYAYAIEQGLVPCDLHGGNIMITSSGEWKYIDLGLYFDSSAQAELLDDQLSLVPTFWRTVFGLTGESSRLFENLELIAQAHYRRVMQGESVLETSRAAIAAAQSTL